MEEQIIRDYLDNILTILELSKKYHKAQSTIKNILHKNNIEIRTASETNILKRNIQKGVSLKDIEEKVIYNYAVLLKGQKASGEEFGLHPETVKKILNKHNIPIRNFSDAAKISNGITHIRGIKYGKDEQFFSKESHNMAWLLGFLASDGNVRKNNNNIRIELSIVDEEILLRIKDVVQIENPLTYRDTKIGKKLVCLSWNCKQHKDDLAKYSIVPHKTYILNPPYELSEKYRLDYIRGYFDGDGTININNQKDGRKSIRFGICGASKEVLEWIVDVLEDFGIKRVNLQRDNSKENVFWSIIYSTKASREIYKLLYNDILNDNSILYLKRKKDKYEKILEEVPERLKFQEALRPKG